MPLSARQYRFLYLQAGWALGCIAALSVFDRVSVLSVGVLAALGALVANEVSPPLRTVRARVRVALLVLSLVLVAGIANRAAGVGLPGPVTSIAFP